MQVTEAAKSLGVSQSRLAKLLGVSRQTLYTWKWNKAGEIPELYLAKVAKIKREGKK